MFLGVLGEFCTGWARQANVPGEFCTGWAAELDTPGEFCTGTGPACGTKFSLLGLVVGECAKKFAQRTKNGPKTSVCGVPGELFRENTAGGVVLGEVFRGTAPEQSVLGEFCRTTTQARLLLGCLRLGSNRKG